MNRTRKRFRSTGMSKKVDNLEIVQSPFNEKFETFDGPFSNDNQEQKTEHQLSDTVTVKKGKMLPEQSTIRTSEQNIIFNKENQLRVPYQFIQADTPNIRMLILPQFSFKTIIFPMSIVMLLLFISLFAAGQILKKNQYFWGCIMFQSQNKFYPRLKFNYQIWRIFVSGLFHSNFVHLVLNLIGIQMYGYFVQWYLGKIKFVGLLFLSIINSHLLSCLTNQSTVSTTASGILYAILAIKLIFFFKYRNYQALQKRRNMLWGLFGLIFAINIIPIFVGGNVDFGGHIGGFITGIFYGIIFYQFEKQTTKSKVLKYSFLALLIAMTAVLIGVIFGLPNEAARDLNGLINNLCQL